MEPERSLPYSLAWWIILKRILNNEGVDGVNKIQVVQDMVQWQTSVNTVTSGEGG